MPLDASYTGKDFKSVGTRPLRPDGIDKVTGRAKYGADHNMPGQLTGLILRSPHAHAKIKKIDTSKAEKLAGVKAVLTAADLPDLTNGDQGMFDMLDNCMARTKVFYDGHAVAAVAATDMETAKKALKLIKVDYEVLPHVTEVDEAVKPSAPVLHANCFTEGVEPKPKKPSNIAKVTEFGHGDVEAGFAEADFVIERNFKTEQTHQGYIEPHACVASVSRPTARANSGSAPRATSSTATTAPCCSAWMCRSCASPPPRSAAASAARPMCGWSPWHLLFRARPTAR
jgi:CO/xanthine dehydrogenase Mo-binding subunit